MTDAQTDTPPVPPRGVGRRTLIAGLAWSVSVVLAVALTGCPRFTASYAVFLAVSLVVAGSALWYLRTIWRGGGMSRAPGFKKFTGYAIVAQYVAHSLPRVGWEAAGLITDRRAAFLFALTLVFTAVGILFFILMARDPAYPRLDKEARKKVKRGPVLWALDWVDALASAIIAVLLIQIFVFQLYKVPTESMVPVFLANDRPFTLKLLNGPRLPLTDWRLPTLRKPMRGDVVTIANPRYPENSGVNLKKYLSQMVYMGTITLVNIDTTTADGTPKADPLVKRIVGVPGEKLMMVDDVLYARTAGRADFTPVKDDQRYARTDLWKLPEAARGKVQAMPVNEESRAILAKWDGVKNGASPDSLAAGLRDAGARLSARVAAVPAAALAAFEQRELPRANAAIAALRDAATRFAPAGAANPISQNGAKAEDLSLALALCRSASARAAMAEYVGAGASGTTGPTAYERGSRAVNLLVKTNLVDRVSRDCALIAGGAALEAIQGDAERARLVQEARELYVYLERYYDMRNFPEFPAEAGFLGPGQYFAMGDNRYNSLDFRFSETSHLRALDPSDASSVMYHSMLEPFALEERYIEGWAVLRVWPFSRLGVIR